MPTPVQFSPLADAWLRSNHSLAIGLIDSLFEHAVHPEWMRGASVRGYEPPAFRTSVELSGATVEYVFVRLPGAIRILAIETLTA